MKKETSVTREELAARLGFTRRTLYNRIKKADIIIPKGLISPKNQQMIRKKLGYK